jgi:hypothetical protein
LDAVVVAIESFWVLHGNVVGGIDVE